MGFQDEGKGEFCGRCYECGQGGHSAKFRPKRKGKGRTERIGEKGTKGSAKEARARVARTVDGAKDRDHISYQLWPATLAQIWVPTLAKPTLANFCCFTVFWPNFLNPKSPNPREPNPKHWERRSTLGGPTLRAPLILGLALLW